MSVAQSGTGWRRSLKWRLILSHGAVILLALGLVFLISAAYLRRYERTAESERLTQLAVPLVAEINVLTFANRAVDGEDPFPLTTLNTQAEAMNVRLLVVDPDGLVRFDSEESATLRRLSLPDHADVVSLVYERAINQRRLETEVFTPRADELFAGGRVVVAAGQTGQVRPRRVLMIVAEERRYPLLGLFLPRLAFVTGLSLFAAAAVGYGLSRRISAPVERLTSAVDNMAAGTLEQAVPGEGPDDIGRLVASFNTMSARVAASDRAQRDLLANVAHELRTPLTSVQGYARAMRDGVIDDAGRPEALGVIQRQAERMNVLIGQLLDLARLESGQTTLAREPVPLEPLLTEAVAAFRPAAAERDLVIEASAPPDVSALGDAGRLGQVLSNLIGNAIRHTDPGGIVSVRGESGGPLLGAVRSVRIAVTDTGSGIPAELLPRIFDRFERGDDRAADGFGLGLAIVQELVERQGGSIQVTSRVGSGTTFTIDLPRA